MHDYTNTPDTRSLRLLKRSGALDQVGFLEEDIDLTIERAEELAGRIVNGRIPVISEGRHPATVAKFITRHPQLIDPGPKLYREAVPTPGFFRRLRQRIGI